MKTLAREPTDAMCIAAREKIGVSANAADHIFQAMYDAAPETKVDMEPVAWAVVSREGKLCSLQVVRPASRERTAAKGSGNTGILGQAMGGRKQEIHRLAEGERETCSKNQFSIY